MHEEMKKSDLSKCKIKKLKKKSSLVTFIGYAMVLSFFKANLVTLVLYTNH